MIRRPRETPPAVPPLVHRRVEHLRTQANAAILGIAEEVLRGQRRHDVAGNFRTPTLTEAQYNVAHRAKLVLLRKPETADIRTELQQRTAATPEKKRAALLDGAYGVLGTEDIEKDLRRTARSIFRTIDGKQHWETEEIDATRRIIKGPRIDFGNTIWRTGTADEILIRLKEAAGATMEELGITIPKSKKIFLKDGTRLSTDTLVTWQEEVTEDEDKGNAEEIFELLLGTKAPIRKPAARLWEKVRTVSFTCNYRDPTTADVSTFRVTVDTRKLLGKKAASGAHLAGFDAAAFSHNRNRSCLDDIATIEEDIGGVSATMIFSNLQEGPVGARRRSKGKREAIIHALFKRLGEDPGDALAIHTDVTLAEALRERSALQHIADLAENADKTGNHPRARLALLASDMLARNPHLAKNMSGKAVRRAMALEELAREKLRKLEESLAIPINLRASIDALGKISPTKLPDETPTKIWNEIRTRTGGKLRIDATGDEEIKLTQWDSVLPIFQTVLDAREKDTKFAKAFEKLSGIARTATFTKATLATWLKGRDTKTIAHVIELAYRDAHGEDLKKGEEYEEQKKATKEKIAAVEKRTEEAWKADHQKLREQPDRACWRVIGAYMTKKYPKQTPKERRKMLFELRQSLGLPEVGCSPQVFAENAPKEYLSGIKIHHEVNLRSGRDRDDVWEKAVQHFNHELGLWNEDDDTVARSVRDFVRANAIIWIGCRLEDLQRKTECNRMSTPRLLAAHTRFRHLLHHGIPITEHGKTKTFPFPRDPEFLLSIQNIEEAILRKVLLLSRHGKSAHIREGELAPIRLLVGTAPWTIPPHEALQRAHASLRKNFGGHERFFDGMERNGEETQLKKWLWNAEDHRRFTQINPFQELLEQGDTWEPMADARRQDRWGRRLIPTRWKLWRPWSWNHMRFWEKRFWTRR